MKYVKILLAIATAFIICSAFSLKDTPSKPIYAFGVSASFTDTIVYFTPIQVLDSATVTKEGFLAHRDIYSLQFNSTSMVYYSKNKKKLEKEEIKILNKYKKNKNITVLQIESDKFRFTKPE